MFYSCQQLSLCNFFQNFHLKCLYKLLNYLDIRACKYYQVFATNNTIYTNLCNSEFCSHSLWPNVLPFSLCRHQNISDLSITIFFFYLEGRPLMTSRTTVVFQGKRVRRAVKILFIKREKKIFIYKNKLDFLRDQR